MGAPPPPRPPPNVGPPTSTSSPRPLKEPGRFGGRRAVRRRRRLGEPLAPIPPDPEAAPVVGDRCGRRALGAALSSARPSSEGGSDGRSASTASRELGSASRPSRPRRPGGRPNPQEYRHVSKPTPTPPLLDASSSCQTPWGAWIDRLGPRHASLRAPSGSFRARRALPMASVGRSISAGETVLARRLRGARGAGDRRNSAASSAPVGAARGPPSMSSSSRARRELFPQKVMETRCSAMKTGGASTLARNQRRPGGRRASPSNRGAARRRLPLVPARRHGSSSLACPRSTARVMRAVGEAASRRARPPRRRADGPHRLARAHGTRRDRRGSRAIRAPHRLFQKPEEQTIGTARYLLSEPHLARASGSGRGADPELDERRRLKPCPRPERRSAHVQRPVILPTALRHSPPALQILPARDPPPAPQRGPTPSRRWIPTRLARARAQFEVLADLRDAGSSQ
jgi:hypothetical protein